MFDIFCTVYLRSVLWKYKLMFFFKGAPSFSTVHYLTDKTDFYDNVNKVLGT